MSSRFHDAYRGDPPPWDVGHPQPAIAALQDDGTLQGPRVLDVGCGTGEHALLCADHGLDAWGVDLVPAALDQARTKAAERGLEVTWRVHDALDLGALDTTFDDIIDVGVFHVFDDADRARYVQSLAAALSPGGSYHFLVFSDAEPTDWGGPRRISEAEVHDAFQEGWTLNSLREARLETRMPEVEGRAWLGHVVRADA